MNLLLTQFFPNNNFTARHQSLIGQKKLNKKVKSHEVNNSPPRASNKSNQPQQIDASGLNLTNMKMRVSNGHPSQNQQVYL